MRVALGEVEEDAAPPTPLHEAIGRAIASAKDRSGVRQTATRSIAHRRSYAGNPLGYFRDILGWTLTPQQEAVLELIERSSRVLIPSGNNLGKTFLIGGFGVYVMDAVAAVPDEETGSEQQGARVLLPGPDHDTVFETVYSSMLVHAARAEARGHLMPGERSERSVLWRVRPQWHVEVLTPQHRVARTTAHTASGRHHRNQVALVEEGQGVEESLWRSTEGMCSAEGNKIISPFNPTEPVGPAYQRARSGAYRVRHLDAFEHPNVLERRAVVAGAVAATVIDERVRTDCRDRGPYPATEVEPSQGDFVYALAPIGEEPAPGVRDDGQLGVPGAPLRVCRPNGAFSAQVRGQWPLQSENGLFDLAAWDHAVTRWRQTPDPKDAPDRVGADPAREGRDDHFAAPAWGDPAEVLLRAYAEAQASGAGAARAIADLQRNRRARVGEMVLIPKGDGVSAGDYLVAKFPDSPFNMDLGGVGTSPHDYVGRVRGRDVIGVSFAAVPRPVVKGEPWSENMRTQLYVRAAMVVQRGLIDVPDDPLLREEILAHDVIASTRTAEVWSESEKRIKKTRVPSVALISKDEIKKRIGRSPDRADAFVLSIYHEPARKRGAQIPPSVSSVSLR